MCFKIFFNSKSLATQTLIAQYKKTKAYAQKTKIVTSLHFQNKTV